MNRKRDGFGLVALILVHRKNNLEGPKLGGTPMDPFNLQTRTQNFLSEKRETNQQNPTIPHNTPQYPTKSPSTPQDEDWLRFLGAPHHEIPAIRELPNRSPQIRIILHPHPIGNQIRPLSLSLSLPSCPWITFKLQC